MDSQALPPWVRNLYTRRTAIRAASWAFIAAMLFLLLVGAEFLVRMAGLGYPVVYYTNASYRYMPYSNQHESRYRGIHLTIGSESLRGTRDWHAPADARILFIGDSVTYGGSYIDDGDTFAGRTCIDLEAALHKTITCGNDGVNGWGTDNMTARIRYKHFDNEDAVVVAFPARDAIRGLAELDVGAIHTEKPRGLFKGLREATIFSLAYLVELIEPRHASEQHDDDVPVAKDSLQRLFAELHRVYPGRRVLIVFSPVAAELHGRQSALTAAVREAVAHSGFDYLDMTGAMARAAATRNDLYRDGVHLEPAGHKLYADAIAKALLPYIRARVSH